MTIFSFGFLDITLVDLIDIVLVTWVFHRVSQYFKDTRAGQMLVGLLILLISSSRSSLTLFSLPLIALITYHFLTTSDIS